MCDPRDIWADRKTDDDRHWRTVTQFAQFHKRNIAKTIEVSRDTEANCPGRIRCVNFEDFILDAQLREMICDWALSPADGVRVKKFLYPDQSRRNIGLHADLDDYELRVLESLNTTSKHW